jgi:hypothetical protein
MLGEIPIPVLPHSRSAQPMRARKQEADQFEQAPFITGIRRIPMFESENSPTEHPVHAAIEPTNTMIKYACHSRLDEQRRGD